MPILAKYNLKDSSKPCRYTIGYSPIETGWKECKSAAEAIGFKFSEDNLMGCEPKVQENECQRCFYFRNNNCLVDIECGSKGDRTKFGNNKILCKQGEKRKIEINKY